MKKLILVFVAILSINQFINAQDEMTDSSNKLDIRFGVKAGLNLATVTGDLEDIKSRISFHFGGIAEIMINEELAIQPELLYSGQGGKYDEFTLKLNYLYLSIMAKYFVSNKFRIEVGPQFGYLLSAKLEDDSSSNSNGDIDNLPTTNKFAANSEDVKEEVKSFDFGLNIGASYILKNNINLSLRYYLGLANGNDLDGNNGDFKNSVFQLSASYFFN